MSNKLGFWKEGTQNGVPWRVGYFTSTQCVVFLWV